MIVPRLRLIAWTALIVLPFAALAGSWAPAVPVTALLIGGLAALALGDAILARSSLRGLRVELPALVRMQKDRPAFLEATVRNNAATAREVQLGIAFPEEIAPDTETRRVRLPAGAESSRIDWPCTGQKRGRFVIDRVFLEANSPLGFWAARGSHAASTELRVYPDLLSERRNVAAVFLRRNAGGIHAQRSAGQGREFEKLREYVAGDSIGDVHWKASGKRRQLVTKVHQVERSHEVYVIVDGSRLSARSIEGKSSATALERFVTAALILGMAAEQQGDQFGLVTFTDRVLSFMRARSGPAHFDACRDQLYTLQPEMVTPDFEELCAFLKLRLRKRALLVFLTALDDPFLADSFVKSSELLSRKHLLLVNTLRPGTARPLFSNSRVARLDDVYQQLGGHWQWQRLRELEMVLRRRGIRFAALDSDALAAGLVRQHAEVRARELV